MPQSFAYSLRRYAVAHVGAHIWQYALTALFALGAALTGNVAVAQSCYFTNWVSEEGAASEFCRSGYAAKGVECSGPYCDNKRVQCCPYMQGADYSARFFWSEWFSEEPNVGGGQQFNTSAFVVGLSCLGSYCDNIRLNFLSSAQIQNTGACRPTSWFSEENAVTGGNAAFCEANEFVSGAQCSGSYCDNIQLVCCQYLSR